MVRGTRAAGHLSGTRASIATVAIGIAGFLVMMGLGGAAAAYVFADRIALILAR